MTMHEMVLEFMEKHDQVRRSSYETVDYPTGLLRARLIMEELGELWIGVHQFDIEKIIDAVADLRYVVVGTAVAYGVEVKDQFGSINEEFGARKQDVEISEVFEAMGFVNNDVTYLVTYILEDFEDEEEFVSRVNNALNALSRVDSLYNVDGQSVFYEVHRANMTKPKLDKHNKGGKVLKEGYVPPNFQQFLQ